MRCAALAGWRPRWRGCGGAAGMPSQGHVHPPRPCPSRVLCLHTRRWDQLQEAVSREAAREEGGEEGGEGGEAPSPDKLLNIFRSLVLERYIERVPPCTLPPPANQVRLDHTQRGAGLAWLRAGHGRCITHACCPAPDAGAPRRAQEAGGAQAGQRGGASAAAAAAGGGAAAGVPAGCAAALGPAVLQQQQQQLGWSAHLPACLLACLHARNADTRAPVHPCTPALPSPAVRFTLPDDLGTDAGASPQGDKPAAKRKRGKDGAAEGERRPAGAVQCYLCMALHRQHMGAP